MRRKGAKRDCSSTSQLQAAFIQASYNMAIYINHAIKWLVHMRVQKERQDLMVTDRK
jgi:hypothetical protein